MKLNKNYWKKGTAGNIGFAICGIEGSCVESFVIFSRKKKFPLPFFCNLVSGKLFLLSAVFNRTFRCKSPHIAKPFPVSRNCKQIPRKKMKEIWQFKKTIVDSEPYYIDNLNIWEFEWKNTGETIQIQDPLYKQNYSFNVYEINSGNKTTRFSAGEFSNLQKKMKWFFAGIF